MTIPLEVTLERAGRTPYRLTDKATNHRWTTAAMGGFGSCQFSLPGPPQLWKRELSYLGMVRLVLDTQVIWEGRIEDITLSLLDESTTVTCIGLQSLLSDVSVRRIWSKRDLDWQEVEPVGVDPTAWNVTIGHYDLTDLSLTGIEVRGQSAVTTNAGETLFDAGQAIVPIAITPVSLLFDFTFGGAGNFGGYYQDFTSSWTNQNNFGAAGAQSVTVSATAKALRLGLRSAGAFTVATTQFVQFSNIRLLGTSLAEDVAGGYYGGTVLRDLIALVPGLTLGIIETGSDYTIQTLERSVRDTALSVVTEVAAYYSREWRVWEDGRFDWKSVNADEPQWIATLADLDSGSEVTSTVDGLAKTIYVLYTDAASGLDTEASSTSTDQRNPFVKQGKTRDIPVSPGFPMTSSSASQLASRLTTDQGTYPLVQGKLVLPAMNVIKRASGSPLPAFMIRAGDNIVIADAPKTDLFSQGRDGETLFHIVSTEADLEAGSMTLEIEGQTRRSDVLLARLAAATRVLTG